MAKRRRLETPSADDLSRIEAEFRDETQAHRGRGVAPIATVVADSAGQSDPDLPEQRAERARTEADATRYRDARERGLLVVEIPVAEIDEKAMIRDRTVIEEEDQIELRNSIAAGGLRMPVEVFETGQADGQGARYGLLSGYRRLRAGRDLAAMTGGETFTTIRAIVRPQAEADRAYVQMVEENEVRADLSNFERGRIAVIAAMQGAFPDTQAAVNALFASGSKAKRSKVRSFALIFEELGDMLAFPESLTETRGLRLATALRGGAETDLRAALSERVPQDAEEEWAVLEEVIARSDAPVRDPKRGGRPRTAPVAGWLDDKTIRTSSGFVIRRGEDSRGAILRIEGRHMDRAMMETVMLEIQRLLEG